MQLHDRVNSLLRIGEKKVKEKNQGQAHYNPNRAAGIHSIAYTKAARGFCDRLGDKCKELGVRSIDDIDKSVLDAYMSRYKDASPFTRSREISIANKLFDTRYTPKDFGFHTKRTLAGITRNRGELPARSTSNWERNQDQMEFVRMTGARRSSIPKVCANDFTWSKDGKEVIAVHLKEKNGRERNAVIRLEGRAWLSEIVRSAQSPTTPLFSAADSHCGTHRGRSEYAVELLNFLAENKRSEHPIDIYDGRKFELFIDREIYDRRMNDPHYPNSQIKSWDKDVLLETSFMLGHSRYDVMWHYVR